jgi:hypothetical protein
LVDMDKVLYDSIDEREFCESRLRRYERNRKVRLTGEKRISWLVNMRDLYRLKNWKMRQIRKVLVKVKLNRKKG